MFELAGVKPSEPADDSTGAPLYPSEQNAIFPPLRRRFTRAGLRVFSDQCQRLVQRIGQIIDMLKTDRQPYEIGRKPAFALLLFRELRM